MAGTEIMLKNFCQWSVIIVNYNCTQTLTNAIVSFLSAHRHAHAHCQIVIVDNHSSNDEQKRLKKFVSCYSQCSLYLLDKNLGFGLANNYAVAKSRGEYLLFLNPDTICHDNILDPLGSLLKRPTTGLVAPRLLLENGSDQPYAWGTFPTLTGAIGEKIRKLFHLKITQKESSLATPKDWLSGACLGISRSNFMALGGFSSDFFMYFEDVDLSRKAVKKGLTNYLLPQIALIHLGGEKVVTSTRRHYYFAAQTIYFQKWHPWLWPLLILCRFPYQVYCYFKDEK
jgi:GT2 family glycosyltransferase